MPATDSFVYLNRRVQEIANRMFSNQTRKDVAFQNSDAAKADLDALGPDNAQISADIDTQAAANPGDAAWQSLKAEKDAYVSEFSAQSDDIDLLVVAMEPYRPV